MHLTFGIRIIIIMNEMLKITSRPGHLLDPLINVRRLTYVES
jgi:hypothetical protein